MGLGGWGGGGVEREWGRRMGKKLRWGEGGVEGVMWMREKVGKKWE